MSGASQLDILLVSSNASCIRYLLAASITLCVLLDVAACILLRLAPTFASNGAVPPVQWTPEALLEGLSSFRDDTVDSIALLVLRLLVTGVLSLAAVVLGKPRLDDLVPPEGCVVADGTAPLITNTVVSSAAGGSSTRTKLTSEVDDEHLVSFQRKQAANLRKNMVSIAIFVVSTISQA